MEQKLTPGLAGAVVLSLIIVCLGVYLFVSGQSLEGLKERFLAVPISTPTTTAKVTPTPEPVTFSPEEGTVEKISGKTLTLATPKGVQEVKIEDVVPVYKFVSAGSDEAPPLSEEVGFAGIKVGDKLTLFWTDERELKAIYISYE